MPAQKRLQENADEDLPMENGGLYQEGEEEKDEEEHQQDKDSDRSPSSCSGGEKEFILVALLDVRKEVQCPICLGIIRKTRTMMECLHRFCRECIDKSMRMGNKECPACRTHCASRRSLRDDPNYDALIAALYPDIDQYEEEELAFHEEEDARNKQIQASIAQTLQRQSAALSKKRKRSQSIMRRANYHSDDDDAVNGNSSSADERPDSRPKRCRRWGGQQSPPVANGGGHERNDSEANRDTPAATGGLVGASEMLAWGRGGLRSHTRHGNAGGCNNRQSRMSRINRLIEHLQNLDENVEMDIQIMLLSLDGEKTPSLQHPYLCCKPSLSVRQICEFIASETSLQADEFEMLAVKELHSNIDPLKFSYVQPSNSPTLDASKDELQLLDFEQTLKGVLSTSKLVRGYMILAYRRKGLQRGDQNEDAAAN